MVEEHYIHISTIVKWHLLTRLGQSLTSSPALPLHISAPHGLQTGPHTGILHVIQQFFEQALHSVVHTQHPLCWHESQSIKHSLHTYSSQREQLVSSHTIKSVRQTLHLVHSVLHVHVASHWYIDSSSIVHVVQAVYCHTSIVRIIITIDFCSKIRIIVAIMSVYEVHADMVQCVCTSFLSSLPADYKAQNCFSQVSVMWVTGVNQCHLSTFNRSNYNWKRVFILVCNNCLYLSQWHSLVVKNENAFSL